MLHIVQNLSKNIPEIIDTPYPSQDENKLIIRTELSLISPGTERMLVEFGGSNLIKKSLDQPDKVKQVLAKGKTDGYINAYKSVKNKLDDPISLGYSNVGVVVSVGKNVKGFSVGDRVISNGPHAEFVSISPLLCALIPDDVENKEAVFTVPAAIALQGIRLANPSLGEVFLVSGLGLIGLLAAQLLNQNGVKVLGVDIDPKRVKLAKSLGVNSLTLSKDVDPVEWCLSQTEGIGVDGVLITAATKSNEPIEMAAKSSRQRGRIILVGVTGLNLNRDLFYKKELKFQVSCSYGPGRYDKSYEEKSIDYPIGFVRWTEERNFKAILEILRKKRLKGALFISHSFPIHKAVDAYKLLLSKDNYLAILIKYKKTKKAEKIIKVKNDDFSTNKFNKNIVSFVGAGNFSKSILIPSFLRAGAQLDLIVSKTGLKPAILARKFGFKYASTDLNDIFKKNNSNSVIIATRHNSHAELIIECLKNNKNVFVEKPLCLNLNELEKIKAAYTGRQLLMVGYNRRFSPHVKYLKNQIIKFDGPKSFVYTCNAGSIPYDHWTQDSTIGGGRLVGEACHFLDLLRFLAGSQIINIEVFKSPNLRIKSDNFSLQIVFKDGSIGTIHYFSNGNRNYPKERLEVFFSGKIISLDNFRKIRSWGLPGLKISNSFKQDKGHDDCIKAYMEAVINSKESPIPVNELFEVQEKIFEVMNKC